MFLNRLRGAFLLLLFSFASILPAQTVPLPPPTAYVQAKGDYIYLNGKPVRYWAAVGRMYIAPNLANDDSVERKREKVAVSRKSTDALIQRLVDLGFNSTRFWDTAPNQDYVRGDGSKADAMDYFLAQFGKRGLKVWSAGLNDAGVATPNDATILSEPTTETEWKAAIQGWDGGNVGLRNNIARIWDERLEQIGIRNMKAVATHVNRHTGLRWCDDPVFAVWELSNEEWWIGRMLGGQWQNLPPFFRNRLIARWNAFLKSKYGDDAKLKAAWNGLLPNESLDSRSILFAPMRGDTPSAASINDSNPQAKAALTGLKQQYRREDFDKQRGADVLEFLVGLHLSHKQREAKAVKSWGRSTKLCPLVYDTGIGYEIQSQFLHQNADAVAHDAYVNGDGPEYVAPDLSKAKNVWERMYMQADRERISANRGHWVNWQLKPPGIDQGVPWLEHNRVKGKPFFCYETQIQQPARYRTDFPLRVAALAAIQDWSFVCWHYYAPSDEVGVTEKPFEQAMDITTGGHPQGYHFTFDEVQSSSMRAAAYLFRNKALKPAATPTTFVYGRDSLFDPASMDYAASYGVSGMDMAQTVYQQGVRIQIDPSQKGDKVIGDVVKFDDRNTHNPYTPTPEIRIDWKRGFQTFDAPTVASFTGLLANYGKSVAFKSGVVLSDVTINNPAGIYEPMTDAEKFIAFTVCSKDGKPLATTKRVMLSLVSTSYNTGFDFGGAGKARQGGTLPVLVARVGGTVRATALNGMRYTFRDWHMKPIGQGVITNGKLVVPNNQPIFVVDLER